MLKKYMVLSFRNIIRNKSYSAINIFGLSIGIACAILIMLWVADELSYDRFHKNANDIYRVVGDDVSVGKISATCGPLAEYMKANYPDIINTTRYLSYEGSSFRYRDKLFTIPNGAFADPAFFDIFSIGFIKGNPKTALSDVTNIVINESMARKFFGNEDPIGKAILYDGKSPATVTGLIKDMPSNSQLQFNFIVNAELLRYLGFPLDVWYNAGFYTFIQVNKNTNISKLNVQIADIMPKQIPGFGRKLYLQPLTDIHLNTDFNPDLPGIGDKKYIYIFSAAALFLILIACINYINLSTSRSLKRSKEVGLRKVMGSNRFQVIKHLFGESFFFVAISFLIAIILVQLLLPFFNQISGKTITINYFDVKSISVIISLIIIVSIGAGGYPAIILSSIKPVNALKNILLRGQSGSLFRKILVVTQFSLSIILIIGALTVFNQLNFIKSKKLGFDKENILYIKAKGNFQQNYTGIKSKLLENSSIIDVTAEDRLLTNNTSVTNNLSWEGKDLKTDVHAEYSFVDYNYYDMLNIKLKEGRRFSKEMGTDQAAFILNEEAVAQMKLKDPVGKRFMLNSRWGTIIGVIKNTNFKSLHQKVAPFVYMVLNDYSNLSFVYNGIILVKSARGKVPEAIKALEQIWERENPDIPFEYHFLDETIDNQYLTEVRTGNIFSAFSFIAILISCLGLYGLSLFIIESRTKEIGIRKVLGASVSGILKLLYSNFIILILIAALIAYPAAWYGMNKWLENFAYRINMSIWILIAAGGIALAIALFTISLQAIKAATANPVEALKYE